MNEETKTLGQGTVESEWTETPDGFQEIQIDFDDGLLDTLLEYWVDKNLEPASISQYRSMMEKDDVSPAEALYSAVINDVIIVAMVGGIEAAKLEKELDPGDSETNDGC